MSMADVFAPVEQANRDIVMVNTWGHLMPSCGVYEGVIRCAVNDCGDWMILSDNVEGIPGSPWWNQRLGDFFYEVDEIERGSVVEYAVLVTVRDYVEPQPEDWDDWDQEDKDYWEPKVERLFDINVQSHKTILEAYK